MKSKINWMLLIALAIALVIGSLADHAKLAALTPTPKTTKMPAKPYKVGVLFSLTGTGSYIGKEMLTGVEMLFEKVNKAGGINGHPIEWVTYDDGGDHTQAILNTKKLAGNKDILAIVGPGNSGTAVGIISTVNKEEIPAIAACATDDIVVPVTKWMFKANSRQEDQVGPILDYGKDMGWKRVAIFAEQVGPSPRGSKLTKEMAPAWGMEIVAFENCNPGDIEFRPQLTKIKATNPDGIVFWFYNPEYALALKQMKELGIPSTKAIDMGGTGMLETIELAGDAAEGTAELLQKTMAYDNLPADDPQREYIITFVNDYKTKYGKVPGAFPTNSYDSSQVLVHALKDLGSRPVTRATLRDAIEKVKFAGNSGLFKFTPEDHTGLFKRGSYTAFVVKNGKPVVHKIPKFKW